MKLGREIEITYYLHHDIQVNLESLGDALHRKDYYGKEAISEPQVCQFFSRYFLEVPYFEKNTWQVRTTLRKEGIILETPLMNLLLKVKWYKKRKHGAQVETIIVSLFILYICSILIPRLQIWTGKEFTPSNPFLISSRSRWGDNAILLTMYHVQL